MGDHDVHSKGGDLLNAMGRERHCVVWMILS